MKRTTLGSVLLASWAFTGLAQVPHVATNAPKDKPFSTEAASFDRALKPYIEMAWKSYPQAKEKFEKGLPPKHSFFVSARLYDDQGNFEQVFVVVREIKGGKIRGRIASDVERIAGYRKGDEFECDEKGIIDWLITKPDGSEEGNVVGKVIDVMQERRIPLIVQMVIAKDGSVQSAKFESALNHSKQDVTFCIPQKVKGQAEATVRQLKYAPAESVKTNYTYLIYDFEGERIEEPEKVRP